MVNKKKKRLRPWVITAIGVVTATVISLTGIKMIPNETVHADDEPENTSTITFDANSGEFDDGSKTNEIMYDTTSPVVTKYSHTANIGDDGNITGWQGYDLGLANTDTVTISGAKHLYIDVWFNMRMPYLGSDYDYLAIYPSGVTPSSDNADQAAISNGKLHFDGNGNNSDKPSDDSDGHKEFVVNGDTAQFYFVTGTPQYEGQQSTYAYGYYAVVTNAKSGPLNDTKYKEPAKSNYAFKSWNTAADGSGTEYKSEEDIPHGSDLTLYAQWNEWYDEWTYKVNDDNNTIELTKYNGKTTDYTVPAKAVIGGKTYDVVMMQQTTENGYVSHGCDTGAIKNLKFEKGVKIPDYSLELFREDNNLTSIDFTGVDTSSVTNMNGMFSLCSSLTSLNLDNFDTSNVTDMSFMFDGCSSLKRLNLKSFNTSNVTNMARMLSGCQELPEIDVSGFDTSKVTDITSMFSNDFAATTIDVSHFDTSKVTGMNGVFNNCSALTSVDVSKWNTKNVTNMSVMFSGCRSLTSLDLSSFDTSKVTDMNSMFSGCSLKKLDLNNFDTSKVTNMRGMFDGDTFTDKLDLSNFNTSNVTDFSNMFSGSSFEKDLVLSGFDFSKAENMSNMFYDINIDTLDLSSFVIPDGGDTTNFVSGGQSGQIASTFKTPKTSKTDINLPDGKWLENEQAVTYTTIPGDGTSHTLVKKQTTLQIRVIDTLGKEVSKESYEARVRYWDSKSSEYVYAKKGDNGTLVITPKQTYTPDIIFHTHARLDYATDHDLMDGDGTNVAIQKWTLTGGTNGDQKGTGSYLNVSGDGGENFVLTYYIKPVGFTTSVDIINKPFTAFGSEEGSYVYVYRGGASGSSNVFPNVIAGSVLIDGKFEDLFKNKNYPEKATLTGRNGDTTYWLGDERSIYDDSTGNYREICPTLDGRYYYSDTKMYNNDRAGKTATFSIKVNIQDSYGNDYKVKDMYYYDHDNDVIPLFNPGVEDDVSKAVKVSNFVNNYERGDDGRMYNNLTFDITYPEKCTNFIHFAMDLSDPSSRLITPAFTADKETINVGDTVNYTFTSEIPKIQTSNQSFNILVDKIPGLPEVPEEGGANDTDEAKAKLKAFTDTWKIYIDDKEITGDDRTKLLNSDALFSSNTDVDVNPHCGGISINSRDYAGKKLKIVFPYTVTQSDLENNSFTESLYVMADNVYYSWTELHNDGKPGIVTTLPAPTNASETAAVRLKSAMLGRPRYNTAAGDDTPEAVSVLWSGSATVHVMLGGPELPESGNTGALTVTVIGCIGIAAVVIYTALKKRKPKE